MSYVDAIYNKEKEKIQVVERIDGKRVYKEYDAEHVFYFSHAQGSHNSIYGDSCRKYSTNSSQKFRKELGRITATVTNRKPTKIFESDINPVFRCLADLYPNADTPKLNIGFFDIEVGWDKVRGHSSIDDPFNPITAISLYDASIHKLLTYVLCPPTLTMAEGQKICDDFQDTILFDDEKQMVYAFLDAIENIDVISGWNSTFYDIPYIVNRLIRIASADATKRLCLWNQKPRKRKAKTKFSKKEEIVYDLVGRVHLDYLELYKKHNPQSQHSYKLDFIADIEVGERKTVYEGSLDDLYKKDFRRFIEYNRQDTMLLFKIDERKQFIELANQVAHSNCILLKTTMGTVSLVEQAIINDIHAIGLVAPNRDRPIVEIEHDDDDEDEEESNRPPVVGAYVADPVPGLHEEVGCGDINSLYPSAIRSLNMSPETIVGQVRSDETMAFISKWIKENPSKPRADAWNGIFATFEFTHMQAKDGAPLTIDFEDGTTKIMSARDLYAYVYNPKNNLCISANGTLFRTDKEGIIPMLLGKWYASRQEQQAKKKEWIKKADEANDPETKKACLVEVAFWDQRQQANKIRLNALYGALLNDSCRFFDERLGQSVTLSGRTIVKHLNAKVNEVITGDYNHKGAAIIYADTDSIYFSAYTVLKNDTRYLYYNWSRENIITLYDGIVDITNDSFPEFMHRTFNTSMERGAIIVAGRELVGSKGLFIKKKKYAILMYDKDGKRLDKNGPGELKVMGLDLKRSDTPKYMQMFLEDVLMDLLTGKEKDHIFGKVKEFRKEFSTKPGWEKGSPKAVKNLTDYTEKFMYGRDLTLIDSLKLKKGDKAKVNMPGHVKAAMNWNHLCQSNSDLYSMKIIDGSKVIVCKLKPNLMKMTSVAYPVDETHIPAWFKTLPFDHAEMENVIIDKKIGNLFGVLGWDFSDTKESPGDEFFVF